MNIDGVIISKILEEIKEFECSKVNKLFQTSKYQFIFQLVKKGKRANLVINLASDNYYLLLNKNLESISSIESNFFKVLKKYLNRANLINIEQLNGDRIIKFEFTNLNNLKEVVYYYLYLEFFGKYTNLILVDQNQKIIDSFVKTDINTNRVILNNLTYPLIKSDKKDIYSENQVEQINGLSKFLKAEINFSGLDDVRKRLRESKNIYSYGDIFHVIELKHLNAKYQLYSIADFFSNYFLSKTDLINQHSDNLIKYLKNKISKLNKKLQKINHSYQESLNYENYRIIADDLLTYSQDQFNNLHPNIKIDGDKIDIANSYYKKYKKSKKASQILIDEIDKIKHQLANYQEYLDNIDYINEEDAKEIALELNINQKNRFKINKSPNFIKLDYKNVLIYIGKNNLQNEYISKNLSQKHYLWFHVKDYSGAHVIVNQNEVNEEILRLAAMLAAYYSKARFSSSIAVNYCHTKDLKKFKHADFGKFILTRYKTIYIDIDEQKIKEVIENYSVRRK